MRYYDNTRVSTYKTCPRKFFLRHVLDLVPLGKAIPLIFGSAWHDAMDVVWGLAKSDKSDDEILKLAYAQFVKTWLEEGLPAPENMTIDQADAYKHRTPMVAYAMLNHYVKLRRPFLQEIELLGIEQPFAVPLYPDDANILYIGRLDKKFKYKGRIICGEHKTTSSYAKATYFRTDFIDSFSPNSQVDGYIHELHMEHPDESVGGVWIDAALVHKTVHEGFKFIPIDQSSVNMNGWLLETRHWISKIETELDIYKTLSQAERESNDVLGLFPKNTGACGDYAGCPNKDICKFIVNPIALKYGEPPVGYKVEHWEPFDVLHIDKLGLPREEPINA